MNLLITGGTGFIGKAVVSRLCKLDSFETLYLLVRAKTNEDAEKRVDALVAAVLPPEMHAKFRGRIKAINGDLLADSFITSDDAREDMAKNLTHILHIGASTDFSSPLDVARASNVEGTRKVLDFAKSLQGNGIFKRFDYVSTAFVAGRKKGLVTEDDLVRGQSFSNSYEQSKYEAEVLVRDYSQSLPTVIYRPSIVVGDSRTGYTPHFKVLYWPLRLLNKPVLRFCFINLMQKIDVVPCDYVSKAIAVLLLDDSVTGQTFHLTAGHGNEVKMGKVLKDAVKYIQLPKKKIFPYWLKTLLEKTTLGRFVSEDFWALCELVNPYHFYLKGIKVRFSSVKSAEHLERLSLAPPKWNDYAKPVLAFCKDSSWGRRLKHPEYTYYKTIWGE